MDLLVPDLERHSLKKEAHHLLFWQLTNRQICDLELLLNGGFAPLKGFMGKKDYDSVLDDMRLDDRSLWPMPITLDVNNQFAESIVEGDRITLRDHEGFALAVLTITDIWQPDLEREAQEIFGTTDINHPAVNYLFNIGNKTYIGGILHGISLPNHYDYQNNPNKRSFQYKLALHFCYQF